MKTSMRIAAQQIRLAGFLLAAFLFLFLATTGHADTPTDEDGNAGHIIFEGKLFCPLSRPVVQPFPGIYTDIMITPGQQVKKGETIGRYELDKGQAIEIGREILFSEIDELQGNIDSTRHKVKTLERNEQELRQLTAEKLSPQPALDSLQAELQLTRNYLAFLEKQAANSRRFAGKTLEKIRELLVEDSLSSGQIPDIVSVKAPISGTVLNLHPQLRVDSLIPDGTVLAQIGTMNPMLIRSLVYERDVVHLSPGMTVRFLPDSLPGRIFPATVTAIDRTPGTANPDAPSYYQVEMTVNNEQAELREGFKGRVECDRPAN